MRVVIDYDEAIKLFTRQANLTIPEPSPRLRDSLKGAFGTESAEEAVRQIIADVQKRGDAALLSYTAQLDKVELTSVEVPPAEIDAAPGQIKPQLLAQLKIAAERVRIFHENQHAALLAGARKMAPGTVVRVLARVGIYVPGGTASYPSSVLMTAIPARVAGVKDVIMATPPGKDGHVPVRTLAAAKLAGVDRVFSLGGAQAIAALACGTASVPKVDKICGPGNLFVMLAKKQVYGLVDIDGLQGPSEIVIIADETANPVWCAADILAQAEHDTLAQAILITTSLTKWQAIEREMTSSLATLERRAIIEESLARQGLVAIVGSLDEAIRLSNLYAPEHLCLYLRHSESYIEKITNAGCVFAGEHPTVVMGDYVAGPSHALPTSGTARFASPLNVSDFIRYMNVVNVSNTILKKLGPTAAGIAKAEGLTAHARAAMNTNAEGIDV
jgi:histidinol dehydrogenase